MDLVRAGSICVVVAGHWLMAVVLWRGAVPEGANLLSEVPELRPATWLLQVMPLFFVVGGFADAGSWRSVRRAGGGYVDFVAHRMGRLLPPVLGLLALWVPAALLLEAFGVDEESVALAARMAAQPLWFVALYVLVVACTPWTYALHARFGPSVLGALVLLVAAVDVLRLAAGVDGVGAVNYGLVWLLAHQVGYAWADGTLLALRRRTVWATAVGALLLLVVLTTWGPYPVSMVGLPGEPLSNMSPPTVCLVALTAWLVALALLARPPALRALVRPRVWVAVVAVNAVIMSVFLWHLTALVVVAALSHAAGVDQPPVTSAAWWWSRPLWFAALLLVLAALVAAVRPLERVRPRTSPGRDAPAVRRVLAVTAAAYLVTGLSALALTGFTDPFRDRGVTVLGLGMTPARGLLDLAIALLALRLAAGPRAHPAASSAFGLALAAWAGVLVSTGQGLVDAVWYAGFGAAVLVAEWHAGRARVG